MDFVTMVKKAKQGDKDALVQLIMEQKQDYYKLAFLYMKNREDTLDAMEDMIVILYESIHRLKKADAFHSWSKTILINCCKKLLRKQRKIISFAKTPEGICEGGFAEKDEKLLLEKHMSMLTEGQQEVLKLRYYLDFDYQTIADMVKIPLGTVKSRISTGLKRLKDSMGGEG